MDPFIQISSASPKLFDVFINHRGPDVKQTLATQLYNSIEELGYRAFLDNKEIELGDSFPSAICNAIQSASVHIAIFSSGYAKSAWCLDELALMVKSNAKIIPVFYDVEPSTLRYIREEEGYGIAFAQYKQKGRYLNKLEEWKEALYSVSFINGCEFSKYNGNVERLCKSIVCAVLKELEKTRHLSVAKHAVGLDELVEDFERRCGQEGDENVKVIGIFGMGGCGKTTLAKELFNRKRSEYDGSCFLYDVREASARSEIPSLQCKLLTDLVQETHSKFVSAHEGADYLRHRLRRGNSRRFLIVLDDIDHQNQLDALLVRDMPNPGCLVIVTTRNVGLLNRAGISICYNLKKMNRPHSTELFCWHAFRQPFPASGYETLVEGFVKACGGLPLSLEVFGGHVFGTTNKRFWELELGKVCKTLDKDIKNTLKISYDALDNDEKQIFMDMACFFIVKDGEDEEQMFIDMHMSMCINIWDGSKWSGEHSIQTLKDKCLVVEKDGYLRMHDHLRDLGREMADELSHPRRLWRPRYLESLKSKGFRSILSQKIGHNIVRCFHSLSDDSINYEVKYFLGSSDDYADKSTALLWLELKQHGSQQTNIPSYIPVQILQCLRFFYKHRPNIPSWIPLQNLQGLRIFGGDLRRLWQSNLQVPFQLKELLIQDTHLEEVVDSLGMLVHLGTLVLVGIQMLEGGGLSESLRKLTNLRTLILGDFQLNGELTLSNREDSATLDPPMTSLETIDISLLTHLSRLQISGKQCPSLEKLFLTAMADLNELDLIGVNSLNSLTLENFQGSRTSGGRLKILWQSDLQVPYQLKELLIRNTHLEEVDFLGMFVHLGKLTLSGIQMLEGGNLSESLRKLTNLRYLVLEDFQLNGELTLSNRGDSATLEPPMTRLETIHISLITNLSKLLISGKQCPGLEGLFLRFIDDLNELDLIGVKSLNSLELKYCMNLKRISGIIDLPRLSTLHIDGCHELEELPGLACLQYLKNIIIDECPKLQNIRGIEDLHGL